MIIIIIYYLTQFQYFVSVLILYNINKKKIYIFGDNKCMSYELYDFVIFFKEKLILRKK